MLGMLILNITRETKKTGQKKRLRTLKALDRAALLLARACAPLLDEDTADDLLRMTIFSSVSVVRLAAAGAKVNALARPQYTNSQDELVEQSGP